MEKIVKTPEKEYEILFLQELQKYNPLLTKIRSTFDQQSTLLKSIVVSDETILFFFTQHTHTH
jgi:hypothetical protein